MALSLTKVERRQVQIVREELTPWGLTTAVEMGGKHLSVRVFARDGGVHRITLSCTPKCGDSAVNMTRQKVRKLLRLINGRAGY
ncbi:hypothetical protein NI454_09120 [Brevundimonas diminuta]|uniref:hypothetical protein n=1 Tax=Brevundimonas diminuta TaxID=293 RepID=UPI00209796DB|nr:hypothetical protein [Brevundimonas diminuta]MCO8030111.1 hypothetical protein [Brevundimonas diminuta]